MAESENVDVGMKEHLDMSLTMLLLIAVFTLAFAAFLRYVGNKTNSPGLTAFAGG